MRLSDGVRVAGYIALWLSSTVVTLGIAVLLRRTAMVISLALGVNHWALGLVEKTTIVVAAFGWIVAVMLIEPYYEKGVQARDLGRRFLRVSSWQALVSLAEFGVLLVLPRLGF